MTTNQRLAQLRDNLDPLLTSLAQGVSNEAFVSSVVMPEITVPNYTGKYRIFDDDAMIPRNGGRRALREKNIGKVEMGGWTDDKFECEEHSLGISIDYREKDASAMANMDIEASNVTILTNQLALGREKDRCDLLQNPDTYPTGHKVALSGTSKWSNSASTPVEDIKTARNTIRTKNAVYPNTCILGLDAFEALQVHPDILAHLATTAFQIVDETVLEQIFRMKFVVGTGLYKATPEATTYTDLWGDTCLIAYVNQSKKDQRSMYTPSFAYSFVLSGFPLVKRHTDNNNLVTDIDQFDYYTDKIVKASAGYLITDCK